MPSEVIALLGKFDLFLREEDEAQKLNVQKIIVHPDWNVFSQRHDADISIVVLASLVNLNDYIHPICLPNYSESEIAVTGVVTGWGISNYSKQNLNESHPSKLEIPAVNASYCFTTFPQLRQHSSRRMFCGGYENEGKAPCVGDAGGGFYTKDESAWIITGIVSGGLSDSQYGCDINKFFLYTNVPMFAKWIMRVTMETNWANLDSN